MKWHDPELLRNFGCFFYVLFSEAVFECKKKSGGFLPLSVGSGGVCSFGTSLGLSGYG